MNLTDTCIRRPVLAWMLMAGVVLFGAVALSRIGVSQFPDVDRPVVAINLGWEGAAPDVVEAELIDPVEEALTQVEGVLAIESTARQGQGQISVEFAIDRDIDAALQEVQARTASVRRRLPADIDEPTFSKSNPEDQPIMAVAVSGPVSPRQLADYARYVVKERLQRVPGVGEISLFGLPDRNVRIWLRPDGLDRYGLTVAEVVQRLRENHLELPAGALKTGGREVPVRVLGEAFDLDVLRRLPVGGTAAAPIRLEQVALVEDGFAEITRYARVDGVPGQGLGIRKIRGANAVEVGDGVRAALDEIRRDLPADLSVGINWDSTPFIAESIHELMFEIAQAIVLCALVCWAFLRSWSSTLNVLLAIPMSLLGAIAIVYALGWTLNTFTLLGLGLAVGIVVDDAILVMENIVRRREHGDSAPVAASQGTREIAFSALAATVAIIAIVVPVVFMRGVQGRFFLQFGVVLCAAVALSYIEAVTLAPARCAQLLATPEGERRSWFGRVFDAGLDALERLYARMLGGTLRHPWLMVGGALVFSGLAVWAMTRMPRELSPAQDQSRLIVRITTAVGTQLENADALMRQAEAVVDANPAVIRRFVVTGGGPGVSGGNAGFMNLTLAERGQRKPHTAVMAELRRDIGAIPGVRVVVQDPSMQGFTASRGMPIEFALTGDDWAQLEEQTRLMKERLAASGHAVDVDSRDWQIGAPELRVQPDRARLADVGVAIDDVARTIGVLVGSERIGKFTSSGRRVDVRVQLVAEARRDREDLLALRVRAGDGSLVPLSSLVTAEERPALQAITRRDRQRAITITANVASGSNQQKAMEEVQRLADDLPDGVRMVFGGQSQAMRESLADLLFALGLGAMVAYMVLAAQFNSFVHPFTVLTILPLSLAGGALALFVTGHTLSLFSGIGFILLMGLAKKNSIVLVDFAARRQEEGVDARTAMLHAAPRRLRPILMTSIATIAAAIPIAIGLGPGGETRAPMALTIIGGMVVATTLSLLVVPAVYVLVDRLRARPAQVEPDPTDG